MARQLVVQLVQQPADLALRLRLDLGCRRSIAGGHAALRIKVKNQGRLQGVGQPDQPLVEMCPLSSAQGRGQTCRGKTVTQMKADGGCFVQHEVAIGQHRNQAVRVELEVVWCLVRIGHPIDQHQLKGHTDFLQQDMRRHRRGARVVVKLKHREFPRFEIHEKPRSDRSTATSNRKARRRCSRQCCVPPHQANRRASGDSPASVHHSKTNAD